MTVLTLSQKDQDYYPEQKNHYQAIADAYTDWYDLCWKISQESNSTYFHCDPWKVDFDVIQGAHEFPLDGYLAET